MIISIFPQGSKQQHEKQRAAIVLLMVPCTTLFCSLGISFEGRSRFKSTLNICDGLSGAAKAQQCGFTCTSFLGGHPCISSHANQVTSGRIPLN